MQPTVEGLKDAIKSYELGLITQSELVAALDNYSLTFEINNGLQMLEIYANG